MLVIRHWRPLLLLVLASDLCGPSGYAEAASAFRRANPRSDVSFKAVAAEDIDVDLSAKEQRLEQVVTLQAEAIRQQQEAMQGVLAQEEQLSAHESFLEQEVTALKAREKSTPQAQLQQRAGRGLSVVQSRGLAGRGGGGGGAEGGPTIALAGGGTGKGQNAQQPPAPGGNHLDYLKASTKMNKTQFYERLLGGLIYIISMLLLAYCYGLCLDYSYEPLNRPPPRVSDDDFSFGVCDGIVRYPCDPDWRICVCSCCCGPIRWADTVSSRKLNFMFFWPALLLFLILEVMTGFSLIFGSLPLLILVVAGRQAIRNAYGLPSRSIETYCQDACVWVFCAPCAIMQEALQVEFIEPAPKMVKMEDHVNSFSSGPNDSVPGRSGTSSYAPVAATMPAATMPGDGPAGGGGGGGFDGGGGAAG